MGITLYLNIKRIHAIWLFGTWPLLWHSGTLKKLVRYLHWSRFLFRQVVMLETRFGDLEVFLRVFIAFLVAFCFWGYHFIWHKACTEGSKWNIYTNCWVKSFSLAFIAVKYSETPHNSSTCFVFVEGLQSYNQSAKQTSLKGKGILGSLWNL